MLETRGIPLSVNNEEWVYGTPKKFIPEWPLSPVELWDWWSNFYSKCHSRKCSTTAEFLQARIWPKELNSNTKEYQSKRAKRRNRWRKRNV